MRMVSLLAAALLVAGPTIASEGQRVRAGTALDATSHVPAQGDAWDTAPRLVRGKSPVYPVTDVVAGDSGASVVVFTVATDGSTKDAVIESADNERFAAHALVALRDWQFEPATRDGKPVEAVLRQRFEYQTP